MDIGVPLEITLAERRVALTPAAVDLLIRAGHRVFVERSAGAAARFGDEDYLAVGARLTYDAEETFGRADLLLKVARPSLAEHHLLRQDQILMCNLRPALATQEETEILLHRGVSAVATELIETADGQAPILRAISEIAGPMSIQIAAHLLESSSGGRGILLGGAPGIPAATVVIVGAGAVGISAARTAAGNGAQVIILDRQVERLRHVAELFGSRVTTMFADSYQVEFAVGFADVVIGAVLVRGDRTPHVITETMVRCMKPGSVIIDVSVDQGGCVETTRPTSIPEPTYLLHDVVHFAVPNLTANVARTATYAIANAALPYALKIADQGLLRACAGDPGLRRGVVTSGGRCYHPLVAERFRVDLSTGFAALAVTDHE